MTRTLFCVCLLVLAVTGPVAGSGKDKYEVWAVDQSNSPGLMYGGTIHIWDGHGLEQGHTGNTAVSERIDLGGPASALCLQKTGAPPVRPHMLAINRSQTHAIVS